MDQAKPTDPTTLIKRQAKLAKTVEMATLRPSRSKNEGVVAAPGASTETGAGRPLVIGHRGSSGVLPEHSLAAYRLAIEQGADYIECDVCVTRDLQLICLHESWLGTVTDSERVFKNRRKSTHYIPNSIINVTDHFSFDFTLKELRQLRLRQRRSYRDPTYNGRFIIPTFDEYVAVAKSACRPVGIYPEMKDPEVVNGLDVVRSAKTSFEKLMAAALARNGYTRPEHACLLQSYNTATLRRVARLTRVRLVQLVYYTEPTMQELRDWARFVYGIGIWKNLLTKVDAGGHIVGETGAVAKAHSAGLAVHVYTFRNDQKLAWNFQQDPYEEFKYFIDDLHVDGLFVDFPATLTRFLARRRVSRENKWEERVFCGEEIPCDTVNQPVQSPGPAGPAQSNRPSENCLKCISKASGSKVGHPLRCNTWRCGPYGITWAYWADCGKPGRSYVACATRKACSKLCVDAYVKRYGRGRPKTCESYVRLHKGGPRGFKWNTNVFLRKVARCCRRQKGGC
ncbi:Glycerophosphodiester phosphodiesterase GDPD5 [Lamellibrachia satsuma]|nr:Glycerophosphodiester phosphodiesterase GDPD5 [Lamellibrachia satsuma]